MESVWRDSASVRVLDRTGSTIQAMDLVAVALALVAFIALYGLIELVDRV
jgi:hypothetical protein